MPLLGEWLGHDVADLVDVRRRHLAVVLLAIPLVGLVATPGAAGLGVLKKLSLVSRRRLAPGVYLTHWHATVSGVGDVQDVYRVSWPLGDSHVGVHAAMMGALQTGGGIAARPISRWAALAHPRGLKAAMNGDFFSASGWVAATPSGMLVRGRQLIQAGWGGNGGAPSVGFEPAGRMVFGRPVPFPVKFLLPGGSAATVSGYDSAPTQSDQVGVYNKAGSTVGVTSGYTAVIARTSLSTAFVGQARYTNPQGLDRSEPVAAFGLEQFGGRPVSQTVKLTAVSTTSVRVPAGSSVLIMKSSGMAATGFRAALARSSQSATLLTTSTTWAKVTDVISGKPLVVKNGQALTQKPSYVTDDQWYPEQLRPAIASTATQGWMITIGSVNGAHGQSLTGVQFGRVLQALGARTALQFDNRHSTELYLPSPTNGQCSASAGTCHTIAPGYERAIPDAVDLTYH